MKHWTDMLFSCNYMTKLLSKWRLLIVGSMCWASLALKAVLLDFEHPRLSKYPRISEVLNFQHYVEKMWRNFCSFGPLHWPNLWTAVPATSSRTE